MPHTHAPLNFILSAIVSNRFPLPGQFSRTARPARRRAQVDCLFDLLAKTRIPNRVAAVRGSPDLAQQLGIEVGCKQASICGESFGPLGAQCKILAVRRLYQA
jgi:hypothetical protein